MSEPFESSEAWQSARSLTNLVYCFTRRPPLSKDYGLCDQIQRAAVSVMNNLAEGWETLHLPEKRQSYNYARRSCGEVRSMTYILADNSFISVPEQETLLDLCIRTGKLISGLMRSHKSRV